MRQQMNSATTSLELVKCNKYIFVGKSCIIVSWLVIKVGYSFLMQTIYTDHFNSFLKVIATWKNGGLKYRRTQDTLNPSWFLSLIITETIEQKPPGTGFCIIL